MQSVQMLDVYLSEEYKQYWPEIVKSAQSDDSTLQVYVMEGIRLSKKGFGLVRCGVAEDVTIEGASIGSGDEVFVDMVTY
jgi:hypothetical protein